ncbi:MAG: DUF4405 domain-containing protein [Smithella sp.]|jgi:hypothetical protein
MKIENKLREWATPITVGAFILTAVTGIMLFFKVELGLAKHVHEWFSWLLVIGAILHLIVNWRACVRYLSSPLAKGILIFFLLLTCASFLPVDLERHNRGQPLKRISKTLIQTSLQKIAPVANHSPEEVTNILESKGIVIDNKDQTIMEIAEKNGTSPLHVLDAIF